MIVQFIKEKALQTRDLVLDAVDVAKQRIHEVRGNGANGSNGASAAPTPASSKVKTTEAPVVKAEAKKAEPKKAEAKKAPAKKAEPKKTTAKKAPAKKTAAKKAPAKKAAKAKPAIPKSAGTARLTADLPDEGTALGDMTRAELYALASAMDIPGRKDLRKAQLIEVIEKARANK